MAEEIIDPFAGITDTGTESVVQDQGLQTPEQVVESDVTNAEPEQKKTDEDLGIGDYVMDFGLGVGRGALGFGQSIIDLVDTVALDAIPDVDIRELAGVDREAKTWAGTLAQGVTQFTLGFIPGGAAIKGLSAANKFSKFGKILTTVKAGSKVKLNGKGLWAAGAMSDFISFEGQEERLSNFIQEFPQLQNPVSEYLAADPEDGEIEGRFKNVIEGMFMEFGVSVPLIKAFQKSVSAIKKGRLEVPADSVESSIDSTAKAIEMDVDEAELLTKTELELSTAKTADELEVKPVTEAEAKAAEAKVKEEPEPEPELTPEETEAIRVKTETLEKDIADMIDAPKIGSGGRVPDIKMNTSGDLNDIILTTNKVIRETGKKAGKVSQKSQVEAATKKLREMGHGNDADEFAKAAELLKEGDASLALLEEITINSLAIRIHQQSLSAPMVDSLEGVLKSTDLSADDTLKSYAKFKELLQTYTNLAGKSSEINSQYGRSLASAKINLTNPKAKINVDVDTATKDELIKFVQDGDVTLNPEDMNTLATIFKHKEEDLILRPELLDELLSTAVNKKKLGDGIYTYWVNSILSGPKTTAVNLSSGFLNSTLSAMFIGGGGLLGGNPQMSKALLGFGFKNLNLLRSLSMLKEGLKTGVSPFEGINARSSVTDGLQNITKDNATGWLWENVVKFPTKLLSSTDAVMKEANFRIASQTRIAYEAMNSGVTDPIQISKMVEERMGKVLTEGGAVNNAYNVRKESIKRMKSTGEWDNMTQSQRASVAKADEDAARLRLGDDSALQQHGINYADATTFTNELTGKSKDLADGLRKIPGSRWVVPFLTTPINVLSRTIDIGTAAPRAAVGALLPKTAKLEGIRSKLLADLNSEDAFTKAQAQGKVAFSGAALFGIGAAVNGNHEMITSGGPQNPAERKVMEAAGWQKYSIKIGDKYYSYQKFDPLASIIGGLADMRDTLADPATVENGFAENMFTALMTSTTQNVLDKSFLTGLDTFLGALQDEGKMLKFVNNSASSFIPSVLPQTAEILTGAPATTEVWGLSDALLRRSAFATGGLDPKRNILGEEVSTQELSGVMDRMFDIVANVSNDKDDVVLDEIASLREGFDIPSKTVGGINLVEFEGEDGRTAYDTYRKAHGTVKLRGRTLRAELSRVIKSNWYQKLDARSLPDFRSARIGELQKVIRRYRAEALQETLNAFPEVDDLYNQTKQLQGQQRSGSDVYNQVEALIQSQQ